MQCVLPEGVSWADSLLVIGKLLEGQLIVNHEIYALRGVAKLANAKNAACLEAVEAEVSPRAQRPPSVCLGWWQTARVHHVCCTASSKSQLVIAKFGDLLLGEK